MNKLVLITITLLIFVCSSQAYFKDVGVGVRAMGMGGSYTAVADDGSAAMWNSAGLSQVKKQEVMLAYTALYAGLEPSLYNSENDQLGYHFVSYVHPLRSGSVGFYWNTFQSRFYDENVFCLSYGRKLIRSLYAGINLKRAGWSVEGNEYTELDADVPDEGTSRNGFTFDIGLLLKRGNNFSLGFSAENLLPVDVGLNTKERIPLNLRSGIAYKVNIPERFDVKLLTLLDTTYRRRDHAMDVHIGTEGWFLHETAGLRFGLNSTSVTSGLSYRTSISKLGIQIDYAFIYPFSIQETYGSHRISISLRF